MPRALEITRSGGVGDHQEWRHWGNDEGNKLACEYTVVLKISEENRWGFNCDSGYVHTAPVNDPRFKPNAIGFLHMLGNVFQPVADCYYDDMTNGDRIQYDQDAPPLIGFSRCYRVTKGNYWGGPFYMTRSASRIGLNPAVRWNGVGLRLARTLD